MNAYVNEKQTELFIELGVIFAFSEAQFEEQKQPGIKYCSVLGANEFVPEKNAKEFVEQLSIIHKKGRELEEKGIERIIEEQLANHECFFTGEIDDAVDALASYNVTFDEVWDVYNNVSHKYDTW